MKNVPFSMMASLLNAILAVKDKVMYGRIVVYVHVSQEQLSYLTKLIAH